MYLKKLKTISIVILFILLFVVFTSSTVLANSINIELLGKTEIEADTWQTVQIKISEQSDVVGSIGGQIKATNITVKSVEGINGFRCLNFNTENGKFTVLNSNEDVKGKAIVSITYKLNKGKNYGKIEICEITASNSIDYKEMLVNSVSKTVKTPGTEIPELKKGDINGDKKVTLYDAFTILKRVISLSNQNQLAEDEKFIMDYNDDEKVTLYDAFSFLKQAISGN